MKAEQQYVEIQQNVTIKEQVTQDNTEQLFQAETY